MPKLLLTSVFHWIYKGSGRQSFAVPALWDVNLFSNHDRGLLMKLFSKMICQLLIACMVLMPFTANAGMIGTDQAIASAADRANRDKVSDFISRSDVVKQFEALGLTPATAQDRVNAMTQEEINRIAGKIDSLPAGASSNTGWWIAAVVVVGLIIWYVYK